MNIYTVIARKGDKFESLAIGEDVRSIKDGFKQIDESFGFDEIILIDSRSGKVRGKKFVREVAPIVEKKPKGKKVAAPTEENAPEENDQTTNAPDFLAGIE